jgi:hypothetical protein
MITIEDESTEDSRHDGFISQLMLRETEADVEPVQEEIAVPAVLNINKTRTVPSG